ncbi:EAL domain-containing protein [Enterobacter hormaechei]|uniref:EAL domain-containing protein n=1 Tax=Enterobacter hormaechei TaxID=158836 RepID=UPI003D7CE26F
MLWYQPVVCAKTGELAGCGVLARWLVSDGKVVPADPFIPLAERSGLIIPLTHRLIHTLVADLYPVATSLPVNFHLAINISAAHAFAKQFVNDCYY